MDMIEEISEEQLERFASCFGEGSLVIGCTIGTGDGVMRIPDFQIEEGQIRRLSKAEAEAELILRNLK